MTDLVEHAQRILLRLKEQFAPVDYYRYKLSERASIDERHLLQTKLCYFLFGEPVVNDEYEFQNDEELADVGSLSFMYTFKQMEVARTLMQKMTSLQRQRPNWLDVCTVFVCFIRKDDDEEKLLPVPVFRIFNRNTRDAGGDQREECWFVDLDGRVYKDWMDFLKNNRLPNGQILYPCDGFYRISERASSSNEERLLLNVFSTPASSSLQRVLDVSDKLSSVASLGAIAVTLMGFAPAASVGMTTAASIYGISRATGKLMDRYNHKQSISPTDAEARSAWIVIGVTGLTVVSVAATNVMVRAALAEEEVGAALTTATDLANTAALTVQMVSIAHHGYSIYKGVLNDGKVPLYDLVQLSLSALLFSHSAINFRSAQQMILDTRSEIALQEPSSLLGRLWRSVLGQKKAPGQDGSIKLFRRSAFDQSGRSVQSLSHFEERGVLPGAVFDVIKKTAPIASCLVNVNEGNLYRFMKFVNRNASTAQLILKDRDDPENVSRLFQLAREVCDYCGFNRMTSWLHVAIVATSIAQQQSAPQTWFRQAIYCPDSRERGQLTDQILHNYFCHVNDGSKEDVWRYDHFMKAVHDFKVYHRTMLEGKMTPLPMRDYWKAMQDLLNTNQTCQRTLVDDNVYLLQYEAGDWRAGVREKIVGGESASKHVLYFHGTKRRSWYKR